MTIARGEHKPARQASLNDPDAIAFQRTEDLIQMFAPAGLHRAENADRKDIAAGKRAVVFHLLHARAGLGEELGEGGEAAWPISEYRLKARDAAVGHESLFDYAAENDRINVAAADRQEDALPVQFRLLACELRGQPGRAGAFHDKFVQLDNAWRMASAISRPR